MREAKQRGHSVDEQVLADFTSWIAKSGDGKTGVARPASAPKALNTKALYYALALGSDPKPDSASREGMKLWLKTMREDQLENGSWAAWPETRAPLFGDSNDSMTSLATLAMTVAAESTDKEAKTVRDKGIQWLASASIDDEAQSVAIRLVLWKRLNRPDAESEPLIRRIKDRQNADGGWSQTPKMPSDAWATGQALYALGHTEWKADDPAVARGQAFLIATQRDDGSWPMTSRPTKPNGEGAKNLIPIIGAGSAWAVLGLTRSLSGSHDHP